MDLTHLRNLLALMLNYLAEDIFKDFHLKIDWKISEGGNSGIFYLDSEIEGRPIWHTAPEFKVIDNDLHPGEKHALLNNHKTIYDET